MDASSNVPAPAVPQSTGEAWPGGFSIVKRSFIDFFTNITPWLVGLLVFVPLGLVVLLQILAAGTGKSSVGLNIFSIILGIVSIVGIIYAALCWIASTPIYGLKRADGDKMTIKEVYTIRWRMTARLIGASLLLIIPIIIGFFLLIIPGIVALIMLVPALVVVPYVIVEEDLTIMESIKTARAMTKGHAGKVWGIVGVYLLVGIVIAIPIVLLLAALLSHSASAATTVYTTNSDGSTTSHSSGGGGGGGANPISAISYAYLYRWLKKQSTPVATATAASTPVTPVAQTPAAPVTDPMPPTPPVAPQA